jgi:uncharacterized protein
MKIEIKSLLNLQERDLELDGCKTEQAAVPGKVAAIQGEIASAKQALEDAKKDLTQKQLLRKQKEVDLDVQENAIRKFGNDLNAIKTNEAYRALLGEIDKAKGVKSGLEDQILQLMDEIDQAQRAWKAKEVESKAHEGDLLKQISDLEAKQQELEQQIQTKETERAEALAALPKMLADQYERVRKGKRGAAVVPIRKEQCGGCHMKVSQNLINELRRGQKLIACEACSRIVYLEETVAAL